jgi:hypothetical protein
MSGGIPVRLSNSLTVRARAAASVLDRSLTEQVEHWARLGQVVEEVISARAVRQLKGRSYDPDLKQRVAAAGTAEGQARAAKLIRERNPVRHSVSEDGTIVRLVGRGKRTKPPRAR